MHLSSVPRKNVSSSKKITPSPFTLYSLPLILKLLLIMISLNSFFSLLISFKILFASFIKLLFSVVYISLIMIGNTITIISTINILVFELLLYF